MKLRLPTARVTIWCSAIVSLSLVVAFVVGWWWEIYLVVPGGFAIGSINGLFAIGIIEPAAGEIGLNVEESYEHLWWFEWIWSSGAKAVGVPLWMLFPGSLLVVGLAWRRDWRARHDKQCGLCGACGYDRRGLEHSAKCPECGVVGSSNTVIQRSGSQ